MFGADLFGFRDGGWGVEVLVAGGADLDLVGSEAEDGEVVVAVSH